MKLLQQFLLVMGLLLCARILTAWTGIPVPPTIIAMILLLALLETGVLKVAWLEKIAEPMTAHITLFLIPPSLMFAGAVGLLEGLWLKLLLITAVSAIVIFVVTAKTIEWMMRREETHAGRHIER